MDGPHLIYFADPMCSWCWGFSPVIEEVRERFGTNLPIRLILGGLRPGTTEPMTDQSAREIREHWEHVHEASGQPFDFGFFDRSGFVYDTEPASRAVVVARRRGMDAALDTLRRTHEAFYAKGRDVTDPDILADLAERAGVGKPEFLEAFGSEEARQETWQDFAIAQRAGVRGFPCLIAGTEEGAPYGVITMGYRPAESVIPVIEGWLDGLPKDAPPPRNGTT